MNVWDYIMPHRLLLNRSLRKASQDLRERVDAYQREYDRRIDACNDELKAAEDAQNRQSAEFEETLTQELKDDQELLEDIKNDIIRYTDCYFQRASLYQIRNIKKKQNDVLHEDYGFLTGQIINIDQEIKLLRSRQNELTSLTQVDDIIHLAELCGCDFNFEYGENAKSLLTKVSDAIKTHAGDNSAEKYALLQLKSIVQERSDYLPIIQYISWVIRIKSQFKKQLAKRRSDIKNQQGIIRNDIERINADIQTIDDQLDGFATTVRYHWERPITFINADICYDYAQLNEQNKRLENDAPELKDELCEKRNKKRKAIEEIRDLKSSRRDVKDALQSMIDSHSDDNWKWDHLMREKRNLTSKIDYIQSIIDSYSRDIESLQSKLDSLYSEVRLSRKLISAKKTERKQWAVRRKRIINLIKKYNKNFPSGRKQSELDEKKIIETRLAEIHVIRENGIIEAQNTHEQEIAKINIEHKSTVERLADQKKSLEKQFAEAKKKYDEASEALTRASNKLQEYEVKDTRFVLLKWFFENKEVKNAKVTLKRARDNFEVAITEKKAVEKQLEILRKRGDEEDNEYKERLERCKPHYLRPTAEEQFEEKKLLMYKDLIEGKRKGDGYAGND